MAVVSIIVPVYNAEKHLAATIRSILAQTFTEFELLLVDDGSIDNSAAICDSFKNKDSRVRVFHKKNGGVSSARNRGLKEATGAFVMFADSDDIVDSMWVESLLKTITTSEADLAICSYFIKNVTTGDERRIAYHKGNCCIKKKEDICEFWTAFLENRNHMICSLWNKLFRRDIISKQQLRFDETLSHSEDALFVFKYLRWAKQGISICDSVGYYYLKRNEVTLTSKYKPDYWAVKQRGFSELYDTLKQNGIEWQEIEKAFATHINTVILVAINNVFMAGEGSTRKIRTLGNEILNSKECRWAIKKGDIVQVHWLYRWIIKTRSFSMILLFRKMVRLKNYRKR